MCYIHRINFQSIYQWPGICRYLCVEEICIKTHFSLCLVLPHSSGPRHLWPLLLRYCLVNLKTSNSLWSCGIHFFRLWSWRVPAKDDFIQTFCDKDLGKHRILFTQVVVNNMSHQSCIYDKWQSYPHKANLLIIGRKTEYRFTQTVHTGSEAGSSHWNGPRLASLSIKFITRSNLFALRNFYIFTSHMTIYKKTFKLSIFMYCAVQHDLDLMC